MEMDSREAWIPLVPVDPEHDVQNLGTDTAEGRLAAVAQCSDPPKSADKLGAERQREQFFSSQMAASLGLPVGSITGAADTQTFILEHSRTEECPAPDGTRVLYGVCVRLVVEFSNMSAEIKVGGLPSIAAAAQLGQTRSSVALDVVGYRPGIPPSLILEAEPITVENYAKVLDNYNKLRRHVFGDTANLEPKRIGVIQEAGVGADANDAAFGRLWALGQIANGESCMSATGSLSKINKSEVARRAATDVYREIANDEACSANRPDLIAKAKATSAVGNWRLKQPGPFG
jgi:hypothetical protein